MIHAALCFAFVAPAVVLGSLVFAVALCKEAARGDEQQEFDAQHRSRIGVSEMDVCQGRQRRVATGLTNNRGRGADTPDRTTEESSPGHTRNG